MPEPEDISVIGTNWTTDKATVVYDHHSAYTKINPKWRWWKPWIERFISVPAGWTAICSINGRIGLDLNPVWVNETSEVTSEAWKKLKQNVCEHKAEQTNFQGSIVELNEFLECGKCSYLNDCLVPQYFMENRG